MLVLRIGTKESREVGMKLFDDLHAFIWESMTANNCNTYLIDGPLRVLIDPGHEAYFDHVRRGLADIGLTPGDIDLVICTHCHPDHLEGVRLFQNEKAQFAIYEDEWRFLSRMTQRGWAATVNHPNRLTPDFFLKEGPLNLKGLSLEVYHTPGHSPGSVCLYWPERETLFTGDLIFAEGLGRVDLPGGNSALIKESILRMKPLNVSLLLSGHGDMVSGKAAVRKTFIDLENVWFRYI